MNDTTPVHEASMLEHEQSLTSNNNVVVNANVSDRHMRWFLLALITFLLVAAMVVPCIVFCLTHNLYSFSLFSTLAPPGCFLYRIITSLFPRDQRYYQLAEVKARCAVQIAEAKKTPSPDSLLRMAVDHL